MTPLACDWQPELDRTILFESGKVYDLQCYFCRPPGRGSASARIQKDQKVSESIEWKIWKNINPNDPNSWNGKIRESFDVILCRPRR